MTDTTQDENPAPLTILVGMDAHSEKISLCITRWRLGSDPEVLKEPSTTLDALETTYAKQVPRGSLTVLEASTNAFSIARRLKAIGQDVKVLTSDAVSGRARSDRINDRIDARNLAMAYARGGTRTVHVPDAQHQQWRDLFFGRRNAVKDSVRDSNRVWAFCSGHGLKLPHKSFRRKAEAVRADLAAHGWTQDESYHIDTLLLEYEHHLTLRIRYEKRIEHIVAQTPEMTHLLQLPGVRFVVAFALVAFIEDVHRFKNPKKLVSYIGLNPTVCRSGESEGPRGLSTHGRHDLKSLMVEAAQSALRSRDSELAKWARRKLAAGKPYNLVICAVARKLVTHVWHILMGHSAPVHQSPRPFRLKLAKLASALGRERLTALGYRKPADYIAAVCDPIYPPPLQEELQTDAPASA